MPEQVLHAVDALAKRNESYYTDDLTTYTSKRMRILGINAGRFHDPIVCRLRSLPIRKDLAYGALSYAWGSHPGEEEITINGRPGFKVTTSVAGALRRLRNVDRVRCLWVDAVCVNQANTRERSEQVALMADIFHFAELVFVWLGGCSGTSSGKNEVESCDRHLIEWDGTFRLTEKGKARNDPLCEVHAGKTQWWWRTWAVQEIALGQKIAVLIGPHQLSWQKAREALEQCWLKAPWTIDWDRERYREAYQQLDHIHTVRGKRGWVCNHLRYLLQLTASHAASDPRDKIYGVLGLLEINNPSLKLVPDYSKTYEEVCKNATLHLIQSEESLDILLEDWQRLQKKPFWGLDFARGPRRPLSLLQRGELNYFEPPQKVGNELVCCASRDSKASFRVDGEQIAVYGIPFDTIATVVRFESESLGRYTIKPDMFTVNVHLGRYFQDEDSQQASDAAGDPWLALRGLESLAKQLHTGPFDMTGLNFEAVDVQEQFARTITGDRYSEGYRLQMATSQLYREYAWDTLRGRTFFVTKRGFCGVGAPETGFGDHVAVLFGASMPAVLRHVFPSVNEYRLVGECYISGIMYGELMDSLDVERDVHEYRLV